MDLKTVHSVVNRFQKSIFRNSSFINSGFFASSFKGAGLQFKEHQIYNYGDEVRFIDWKLLARKSTPYVKTFEEERNIEVKVIIDCHPNLILSHNNKSKFITIIEMIAILVLFAGKTKDKVSCYIAGKKLIRVTGLSGENGLLKLISSLSTLGLLNDDATPNITNIFEFSENAFNGKIIKQIENLKNGPFVVFSNFNNGQYEFFRKLLVNKNTHMFKINCPFEKDKASWKFINYGLGYIKKSRDDYKQGDKREKVINVEIDNNPLVSFVEGIMSYETKI